MNKENRLKLEEALNTIISLQPEFHSTDFNHTILRQKGINAGVILLHPAGTNLIYNYKYREVTGNYIKHEYFERISKNNPNGTDFLVTPSCECKTSTIKTKNLTISGINDLGEIDKVYNKINNLDPKYAQNTENHAVFLLYKAGIGEPIIAFYVDNIDFGNTIQPLIADSYNRLMVKSNNLTIGSRDTLKLKLEHFLHCKSLDIAHINENESIYIEQSVLDQMDKKSKFYKSIMTAIQNDHIIIV